MTATQTKIVQGSDLQVGDALRVWWERGDAFEPIKALRPYDGSIADLAGDRIATLGHRNTGMTIHSDSSYEIEVR